MNPELRQRLGRRLTEVGAPDDESAVEALAGWFDLHERWSRAFNLTGTRDGAALVDLHLADCAAIMPLLPQGPLVDFGCGAGLPGLVIALLEPSRPVVLIDSSSKRTAFCEQAVLELGLDNVRVVTARIEAFDPAADPAGMPAALLARAVAPLARLVAWTAPVLARGVPLLAMKGPAWAEEAEALPAGVAVTRVAPYALGDREHVLLTVEATAAATDSERARDGRSG